MLNLALLVLEAVNYTSSPRCSSVVRGGYVNIWPGYHLYVGGVCQKLDENIAGVYLRKEHRENGL